MSNELLIEEYTRRTFDADVVRVTEKNMEALAKWCHGVVETSDGKKYIRVRVARASTDRQRQAFVGDYVINALGSFRVYTTPGFERAFEPRRKGKVEQKDNGQDYGTYPGYESMEVGT